MKPFVCLLAFNFVLLAVGYLFEYYAIGDRDFVANLKIPALQQLFFLGLLIIYRKIFHREPEDTFWSMDWKKMIDGIFNIIFMLSGLIPTLLALDHVI